MGRLSSALRVRRRPSVNMGVQELEGRALLSLGMAGRAPLVHSSGDVHAVELANSLSREFVRLDSTPTSTSESRELANLDHLVARAEAASAHHPAWSEHVLNRAERIVKRLAPGWDQDGSASGDTSPAASPGQPQGQSTSTTSLSSSSAATGTSASQGSPIVTDPITDYTAAAQAWQQTISTPSNPYLILHAAQSYSQPPFTMIPGVPDYAYNMLEGTRLTVAYDPNFPVYGGGPERPLPTLPMPTVVSYTWDLSQAPDAVVYAESTATVTGQSQPIVGADSQHPYAPAPAGNALVVSWHVPADAGLTWPGNVYAPMHLDTITVTADLSDGTQVSQTYTFYIVVGGADWYAEIGANMTGSAPVHPYPSYPDTYVDPLNYAV